MKIEPKFYKNWDDDNHCLQASVMMVLNTLNGAVDWNEVNDMTEYEDGLYSWSSAAAVMLAKRIAGVKLKSEFDYREFAINGEDYLKKHWVVEWFNKQKENASSGFQREQNFAKKLISENLFEKGNIGKKEVERLLKENLIIALVDPYKLAGKNGVAGHFVLTYGEDADNFLLHDPGLPPMPSWKVNKDSFIKAFRSDLIIIPKREIKFGLEIGRNDPCSCGSGKKWKKCCGK